MSFSRAEIDFSRLHSFIHSSIKLSYGEHHAHNTALHYASRHGMKHLIRAFLNDLDGDPNRRNAFGQTSLHVACNVARQKSPNALDRRAYSVILLLRDAKRKRIN